MKIQFSENYDRLSTTWRSKIWSEEVRNTHYSSHSVSLNLKDDSSWKIFNGQIKVSERVYLCSELEMKDHLRKESYARSCREIEDSLKDAAIKKEITEKQRRLEEFPTSTEWSATKITRTIGIDWRLKIFYDPDLPSSSDIPTFLIKLLLPRVQESLAVRLECHEIHERIWGFVETFFLLSTCSTRSWRITTWFKKFGNTIGNR